MRTITGTLYQNTGTGILGASLSLAGRHISIGALVSTVDDQLTKIKPGDVTFTVEDGDQAVWTFIQTAISITSGLLPPFIQLVVGGSVRFLGIIAPSRLTRNQAKRVVSIGAQDWSIMLENQPLGILSNGSVDPLWQRPLPRAATGRPGSTARTGYSMHISLLFEEAVYFPDPLNWAAVGDLLDGTTPKGAFTNAKILSVEPGQAVPFITPTGTYSFCRLSKPVWPSPWDHVTYPNYTGTFTRQASSSTDSNYYSVTTAVTADDKKPVYILGLDTVDGIVPGDELQLLASANTTKIQVLAVDPERNEIQAKNPLPSLAVSDRLFFTQDSLDTQVYEDARTILIRACNPYGCDLSRFNRATLSIPVLSWLALRPYDGADIRGVAYVEPGLANLRVIGNGTSAWDGSPDTTWSSTTATGPRVIWTSQLAAAPTSLMPDETKTLAVHQRRVNRAYNDFKYRQVDNGETGVDAWSPTASPELPLVVIHDYPGMRRLKIAGSAITIEPWTGTAWGASTSATWPGSHKPQSGGPMPGVAGGIVAVVDTVSAVELWTGGATVVSCALPADAAGGVIVTTPDAAYVVGSRGYGRLTFSAGVLTLAWVTLGSQISVFYPNTFCKLSTTEVVMIGRLDAVDPRGGATTTETWLFRLKATPVTGDAMASITWSEKVTDGSPRLVGAFTDPTKAGRVMGHCGGRLFQVDTQLPFTLERFKPNGMSAGELIEHICQLHNAVAVPSPLGKMQIISRTVAEAPVAMTVDQVEITEQRAWENFYSIVRVSTADDAYYYDAIGSDGGKLLEISKHPLVWTLSAAAGMALSYKTWFGTSRHVQDQTWFYTNPDAAPPWEGLLPFARVTVPGDATQWIVMARSEDLVKGECRVKLVEVF